MVAAFPLARSADLLIEELVNELLVYDERRDVATRMNHTAAVVWRNCDGRHTIGDLAELLREEVGDVADQDLVLITLDYLEEQELLEAGYESRELAAIRLSRRRFIQRAGATGAAAAVLPIVQSIVAPTPAAAASPGTQGAQGVQGAQGPQGLIGPQGP